MISTAFSIPDELVKLLRQTQHIAVLTGAGVSAESGVPTFREAQTGLWRRYDPAELATPEAFERNPQLVWDWYHWRRELVQQAQPNPAHHALVQLAKHFSQLDLLTQNVDGLHQQAGSQNVIELHGNLHRTRRQDGTVVTHWNTHQQPPRCPTSGQLLRPDVVWFGEALPEHALEAALQSAHRCGLFLSVGTSSLVYPAAELPLVALSRGIPVVEINPDATPLSPRASFCLHGPAGVVLPALVSSLI